MSSLAQITQVALYGSALWLSIPLALVIFFLLLGKIKHIHLY